MLTHPTIRFKVSRGLQSVGLTCLVALFLMSGTGCGNGQTAKDVHAADDGSAFATVNGEKISHDDLDKALEERKGKEVLDRLILEKLISQEAKKQNIVVDDKEVKGKLDELKANPKYQEAVKSHAIDPKLFEEQMHVSLMLQKLILKEIPEQEKLRMYDRFKDQMVQLRASHILVGDEKEAEKLRAEALKGGDFAKLARENSKDPNSKDNGGDIGYFMKNQMDAEFWKEADSTPIGQISKVVKSKFGYHVIKVTDKKTTYDQLKPFIEDQMVSEQQGSYLERLRAKATISSRYDADKTSSAAESPATAASTSAGTR